MKPWYKVVTPREDLREGQPLDASEFAVHLDHVRDGRGAGRLQEPGAVLRADLPDARTCATLAARSFAGCRASRSRRRPSSTCPPSSAAARRTR